METNSVHNLATQLVQESKSLWRITKHYLAEATTPDEKAFWESLAKDKERQVVELKALLKASL